MTRDQVIKVVFIRSDNGEEWQTTIDVDDGALAARLVREQFPVAEIVSTKSWYRNAFCATGPTSSQRNKKIIAQAKVIHEKYGIKGCILCVLIPIVMCGGCWVVDLILEDSPAPDTSETLPATSPRNTGEETPKAELQTLIESAENGDAEAQFNLGKKYDTAEGVPEDDKEAVKWYLKAAEQGYADAQSNLGLMYYEGKGVPEDYKEAVKWWRKAGDQGNAMAQNNLGSVYDSGLGVEKDLVISYAWFTIAAAKGNALAKKSKPLIAEKMTPTQITETEALVKEMTSKNPKLIQYEE